MFHLFRINRVRARQKKEAIAHEQEVMRRKKEDDKQTNQLIRELDITVQEKSINQVIAFVDKYGDRADIMNARVCPDLYYRRCEGCEDMTIFESAVKNGDLGIINALLQAPALDPNKMGRRSTYSALYTALRNNRLDIVEALAADSPRFNVNAALLCAAKHFPAAVPVFLKAKNINVNAQDDDKKTALHYISSSQSNGVQKLIDVKTRLAVLNDLINMKGINPDIPDKDGWTPLMYAARDGNQAIIAALEKALADPAKQNHVNRTAGDIASLYGHHDLANRLQVNGEKNNEDAQVSVMHVGR